MLKNSIGANKLRLFRNSLEAVFLERPNRYIIKAKTGSGIITAYCPNPGRLIEILTPGRRLILEKSEQHETVKRKTIYTTVAAYYHNRVIPLYSARANSIAENLVIPKLFLKLNWLKREVVTGNSRIDFVLGLKNRIFYLEVKACTLIEHGLAMFPDAPTSRGLKHLKELASITGNVLDNHIKVEAHVLFVIMNPDVNEFMPNIHTDYLFSKTIVQLSDKLKYHAVSIDTDKTGIASVSNFHIPINIERTSVNLSSGGVYLIRIRLKRKKEIATGKLGMLSYKAGYYIYVGSALNNIDSRISRHLRKSKKKHWHIDYLTSVADEIKAYPIRTKKTLECVLAHDISKIADSFVPNFGSSDCSCDSHLFYFSHNPELKKNFLRILFLYRHLKALQ